jgi:hypothetical protein
VLHGNHPKWLLDSYEADRRPVAISNTILSLKNYDKVLDMANTLGVLTPIHDHILHSYASSSSSSSSFGFILKCDTHTKFHTLGLDHNNLQNKVFQSMSMTMGRTAINIAQSSLGCLSSKGHPLGEIRIANLHRLLSEGGGLPLFYPKHELEFGYTRNDLSSGECPIAKPTIGYRVPHCRVRLLSSDDSNNHHQNSHALCSFLDISPLLEGAPCYVLIVAKGVKVDPHFFDQPFIVVEVNEVNNTPHDGVEAAPIVQEEGSSTSLSEKKVVPSLNTYSWVKQLVSQELVNNRNGNMLLSLTCDDVYGDWRNAMGDRTVLIRPDGHVLWVHKYNGDALPHRLGLCLDNHSLLILKENEKYHTPSK